MAALLTIIIMYSFFSRVLFCHFKTHGYFLNYCSGTLTPSTFSMHESLAGIGDMIEDWSEEEKEEHEESLLPDDLDLDELSDNDSQDNDQRLKS